MRRALVVLNPSSNDFEAQRKFPEIVGELEKRAAIDLVETVPDAAQTRKMIWAGLDRGVDRVISVGGDGTVHTVINAIMDRRKTPLPELGVIPFGTANDVAKSLRLPIRDVAALAAIAVGDSVAGVDVGQIRAGLGDQSRDRYFVDSVTIGMDADVLEARGRYREWKGYLAYLAALAERAVEQHSLDVRVEIDDQIVDARVFNIVVNNVPIYAGELELPDSKGDDGLLDVYLFNRREYTSKLMAFAIKSVDVLKLGVSDLLEDLTDNQRAYHGRRIKLRLASPRQVQVDGEVFGEADEILCEIVARLAVAAP